MKLNRPPSPLLRTSGQLLLWGVLTWGVLSLHDSSIAQNYSICGPWGCGPTISALLAAHGFWLLVAIPGAFWASRSLSNRGATRLGWVGLGLGLSGILAVVGQEAMQPSMADHSPVRVYLIQRLLFALATTVQVPLVPTILAGLILLRAGRRRSRSQHAPEPAGNMNCADGLCDRPAPLDEAGRPGPIALGQRLPMLLLVARDGQTLNVPESGGGRATLLYFMRDANCSICRRYVRALIRIFGEKDLSQMGVFVVHPGRSKVSRSLELAVPDSFRIVSGGDSGAYEAVGLAGRNLGLSPGSGTILVDRDGIVRHLRLASLPFRAFSEWELLEEFDRLRLDERDPLARSRADWSPERSVPRIPSEVEDTWIVPRP